MKIIIATSNLDVIMAAKKLVEEWKVEHEGYYGRPHGFRYIWVGLDQVPCGLSLCDAPMLSQHSPPYPIRGVRWMSCGGNDHRISFDHPTDTGIVCLSFCGVRHGLRGDFAKLILACWKLPENEKTMEYHTSKPEWLPWETLDSVKI